MEKKKYRPLMDFLELLSSAEILDEFIVIGSWCLLFYEQYLNDFHPSLRTRDVDILIPRPYSGKSIDLDKKIIDMGYVHSFKGEKGYLTFLSPELIIEFIFPMKGKGEDRPYEIKQLNINAFRLRYLEILTDNTIKIPYGGINIRVPHPSAFVIHKLLVSNRRKRIDKKEKDISQAIQVMLHLDKKDDKMKCIFNSLSKKNRNLVQRTVAGTDYLELFLSLIAN